MTSAYRGYSLTMRSLRSLLQEATEAGAGEHGFGLAQAVHLLVEGSLAGVEVVEREVAALVEVRVLVHELLLLVQCGGESLLLRYLDQIQSKPLQSKYWSRPVINMF